MAGFGYGSWLAPAVAAGGLGVVALLYAALRARPEGNAVMSANSQAVRGGSRVFLRESLRLLGPGAAVLLVPIAWFLGPAVAVSFVWGSLLSFLAVALGVEGACCAASRAAQAAREAGGPRARNTAYTGGAVSGLAVASLGLLGVGAAHVALSSPSSAADLAGFVLGASCVALVSRGGGLLSKASDRGADLLARLGELPGGTGGSDPVKTLALSAEIAADTAGAGADLFDSVAGALVAAVVVASAGLSLPAVPRPALAAFPLLLAGAGLLASIAGGLAVAGVPAFSGARTARLLSALPALVLAFASFGLAALLRLPVSLGAAAAVGGAVSPALGAATRYYASRKPVARLAESSQLGAAANVLAGLAAGLEGGVVPALLLGAALFAASSTAGLVGATLCAVGMASCAGLAGSLAAFAPIASQAHGIAAGSGLGGDARETTESLQAEGVAQSARGRGFAAGAAALAAVALFCGYVALAGVQAIDLNHPKILVGLLVGAALPFLVSAMALNGVGDVALELVAQLRRILREEGAQAGSAAWVRKWVSEASRFAAGRTVVPSLMALGVPVAVGFGLGAEALGGVLAGAIVSGTLLSFALADAGDVWRGGRRWIEAGAMGGEGSEAHRAALVGDAVGEPLKDAAGPAVQVFIKAMAAVSLVIAPILPHV